MVRLELETGYSKQMLSSRKRHQYQLLLDSLPHLSNTFFSIMKILFNFAEIVVQDEHWEEMETRKMEWHTRMLDAMKQVDKLRHCLRLGKFNMLNTI